MSEHYQPSLCLGLAESRAHEGVQLVEADGTAAVGVGDAKEGVEGGRGGDGGERGHGGGELDSVDGSNKNL